MQYDGSINIDTRINTRGVNQGIKTITAKLGAVLQSVKTIAQITGAFLTKLFSLAALGVWFAAFQGIIKALRENLVGLLEKAGLGPQVEELKGTFEELKLAAANAFLPLITAALPYVQQFTSWLITVLNKIAMITAALLGQKNVLQVIAGSLKKAGKELEKSARGALASFDQINVLNTDKESNPLVDIATELVPIDSEVIAQIENIKDKFEEFKKWFSWDFIRQKIVETWESIKRWFDENGKGIFKGLSLGGLIELIKQNWNELKQWFVDNGDIFKGFAFGGAIELVKQKLNEFKEWFILNVSDPIKNKFVELKEKVFQTWREFVVWFANNVFAPLRLGFANALGFVREKFVSIFIRIRDFVTQILNGIIETINKIVSSIAGINLLGGDSIGVAVGGNFPFSNGNLQIPRLATGAVIPPNAQFAAILGDQRSGMNIETPVNLMRQTFEDALSRALANQNITIHFTGTGANIARMLKPELDRENTRIGSSLIKSGLL